jgi:hypothetical protein
MKKIKYIFLFMILLMAIVVNIRLGFETNHFPNISLNDLNAYANDNVPESSSDTPRAPTKKTRTHCSITRYYESGSASAGSANSQSNLGGMVGYNALWSASVSGSFSWGKTKSGSNNQAQFVEISSDYWADLIYCTNQTTESCNPYNPCRDSNLW